MRRSDYKRMWRSSVARYERLAHFMDTNAVALVIGLMCLACLSAFVLSMLEIAFGKY